MTKIEGSFWKKGYFWLTQGENSFRHILLLIMRLYWGSLFVITGAGKLLNAQTIGDKFASWNIPKPLLMAILVGTFEFLGGISLFLGFLTRFFTIPLIVILVTAYLTAHSDSVTMIIQNPNNFIGQTPFLYLLTALLVFSFGPGKFSFDYWLEKKHYGRGL